MGGARPVAKPGRSPIRVPRVSLRAVAIWRSVVVDGYALTEQIGCVASLYECPEYYDILFGWDRDAEAQHYEHALLQHGVGVGASVLEVAAGTAQIGIRLARNGLQVTALDSSEPMLAFACRRAALASAGLGSLVADMRAFRSDRTYSGALNPMSSFRLLLGDAEVTAHLDCMANALTPGGVYLIDLAFGTDGTPDSDLDEWDMERDGITVTATTRNVHVVDLARGLDLTLDWHESLRPYSPADFARIIDNHDCFTISGCYPEAPTSADDISHFESELDPHLPSAGRAIVALSRT
jgi:hypothetical protein